MALHQQIPTSAPTTDQSDVFRLRAIFCERQAREYWTSKQDWEVLAIDDGVSCREDERQEF